MLVIVRIVVRISLCCVCTFYKVINSFPTPYPISVLSRYVVLPTLYTHYLL